MKRIILSVIFAASCAHAQFNQPPLDQIKIAADAGDPASQDKLAENFILHVDTMQAEIWYRKSAEQGYAHAEGKLGNMLLMRYRLSFDLKSAARAELADEALIWITSAANQGDKQLANLYPEGSLIKKDLVEALRGAILLHKELDSVSDL